MAAVFARLDWRSDEGKRRLGKWKLDVNWKKLAMRDRIGGVGKVDNLRTGEHLQLR